SAAIPLARVASAHLALRRRCGLGRLAHVDLHAPVASPPARGGVLRDRLAAAAAVDLDLSDRHAARDEIVPGAGGAVDRERIVDRVVTGAVGVSDDLHHRTRVGDKRLREPVEDRPGVAADVGTVHVEGDVAGDVQHEQVLVRAHHLDAGALGRVLHGALLLLHAGGPDVGTEGTERAADEGAVANALAAALHAADDGAHA